jgi:thiosulfate dehydrogenase [quinone] large subunit
MTTIGRSTAAHLEHVEAPGSMLTNTAARALAALRIATGFVFLWAFLDKTFGLNYSTPTAKAWIHGGSPTKGFLASVDVGPFQGFFHDIAGTGWANWLFMLGLFGIGIALTLGIGMRIAAAAGALLYVLMWTVVLPPDNNPVLDDHILGAITLVVLAAYYAGDTWGLGKVWGSTQIVKDNPALR